MKHYSTILIICVLSMLAVFTGCKKETEPEMQSEIPEKFGGKKPNDPGFAENDMVMSWNDKANIAFSVGFSQAARSRVFARFSIAVHDALNAIKPKYQRYAFHEREQHADPDAAVASAAYWILKRITLPGNPPLDRWYNESLATIPDGASKELGKELGRRSADAIIANRANDGFTQLIITSANPPNGTTPGAYRSTLTATNWVPTQTLFTLRTLPNWGTVMRPWVIESNQQFRPTGPYTVGSEDYMADFNEVRTKGARSGGMRTEEEEKIAKFWSDDRASYLWNNIARKAIENKKMDAWKTARLFALMHVSIAEAVSSQLNAAYYFYSWRPETAIRLAGYNSWLPFLSEQANTVTPRIPGYPNSYAAFGGSTAEILKLFFGSDNTNIEITTTSLNPAVTEPKPSFQFSTFTQAAKDNAMAMVYSGWDFRKSVVDGEEMGRQIARYVFSNHFREE